MWRDTQLAMAMGHEDGNDQLPVVLKLNKMVCVNRLAQILPQNNPAR